MFKRANAVLALLVLLAQMYWLSVVVAMHILEPEFSWLRAPMSAYVLGPYGGWMTTTYFAMSFSFLALGYSLLAVSGPARLKVVARSLFWLAGAGVVLAGLNPMDYPGPPQTVSGRLHAVGGLVTFPSWVFGALFFSLSLRRDQYFDSISGISLALTLSAVLVFLGAVLSILLLGFAGYLQRILVALMLPWMVVVSLQLIRTSRR